MQMKKYVALCTIILILVSCNSDKTKNDSNPDRITIPAPDSAATITNPGNNQSVASDLNHIGELSLGQGQSAVIEKIGNPESKTKIEEWGADGMFHQDWNYKAKGVTLNMSSEKENGEMSVFSITITSPCDFKTKKNIGIGSSYHEVMTAYEKEVDKETSDKNIITVGSLYGGLIIEFKNDKVVRLFAGAAAE
jgi:hypothetical protein